MDLSAHFPRVGVALEWHWSKPGLPTRCGGPGVTLEGCLWRQAGLIAKSTRECQGGTCGASKVGGECWHWFPQVSGYLGLGRGMEMDPPCTFFFPEESPTDLCHSCMHSKSIQ